MHSTDSALLLRLHSCSDFVRLFLDLDKPEVNEHVTWNYELCGNISLIQRVHYSSTASLTMEFHSDHVQTNGTGFRGAFKFIPKGRPKGCVTKSTVDGQNLRRNYLTFLDERLFVCRVGRKVLGEMLRTKS